MTCFDQMRVVSASTTSQDAVTEIYTDCYAQIFRTGSRAKDEPTLELMRNDLLSVPFQININKVMLVGTFGWVDIYEKARVSALIIMSWYRILWIVK